ncbi:MAG: DUF2188 domain-containing protein [Coriobacteriia bacterium]|nr:DUF2188 domain-containing protein [Coriobacteriia bacterium]
MSNTAVHVMFYGPGWVVECEARPRHYYHEKKAAVFAGSALAREMKTELIIHNADGSLGQTVSYEPDVVTSRIG